MLNEAKFFVVVVVAVIVVVLVLAVCGYYLVVYCLASSFEFIVRWFWFAYIAYIEVEMLLKRENLLSPLLFFLKY